MTYRVSFKFKLDLNDHYVYLPNKHLTLNEDEQPISISHPNLIKLIKQEIIDYRLYGLVEPQAQTVLTPSSRSQVIGGDRAMATTVVGLSGEAYVKKVSEISKPASQRLLKSLAEDLVNCSNHINQDNFLLDENNDYISQIRQILIWRDFWGRYVMSNKKIFQKGYIFITEN